MASIATRSATGLRDTNTFKHRTLEEMIEQLQMAPTPPGSQHSMTTI